MLKASKGRITGPRLGKRVFAVKGLSVAGKPVTGKPSKIKGIPVFPVGTDTAKAIIYNLLKIPRPGPGYCHFPVEREPDYFDQLTAERIITKFTQGRPRLVWELPPGKRNEALDVRVYNHAAFSILNPNFARMQVQRKDAALTAPPVNTAQKHNPSPQGRRRSREENPYLSRRR